MPRILDPGANEARISDYLFIIPPQFSHYPVTIWRRRSVRDRRAHQSHSRDYAVTPWCGKPMPTLGGKLRIPGRKAMKPQFPTILPESLHYSGTILSLFGGGGRNRTASLL